MTTDKPLQHRRWRTPVTNAKPANGTPAGVGDFTWHDPIATCSTCSGVTRMARDTATGAICPGCDPTWPHANTANRPRDRFLDALLDRSRSRWGKRA